MGKKLFPINPQGLFVVTVLLIGFFLGRFSVPGNQENNDDVTPAKLTSNTNEAEGPEQISGQPENTDAASSKAGQIAEDLAPQGPTTSPRPPSDVGSAAAKQLLEEAIESQNLEQIWQLAFDLIASGHYEEVDRLYELFADSFHGGKLDSPLWKAPDFYSGNLMREYADNETALLGYLGHLAQLENPTELLADLRLELLEGEAAPMLLGFHEGRNPELLGNWLPYYQMRLENWPTNSFRDREIILSLGYIPLEESALMLMDLLPWTGSSQRLDIVRALSRNATSPAIETLRAIALDDPNPVLRKAAEDALRLIEG
ncbi:MAG: HEAT repeat domain-containing protein [Planctomycetota bacterium]